MVKVVVMATRATQFGGGSNVFGRKDLTACQRHVSPHHSTAPFQAAQRAICSAKCTACRRFSTPNFIAVAPPKCELADVSSA
jgi:hypothetical protein